MPRRLFAVVSAAVTLSACGDPVRPDRSLPGTYDLRSIDGASLPFAIGGGREMSFAVMSATLELRGDGTFVRVTAISARSAGADAFQPPETQQTAGRWTISDSLVTTRDSAVGAPQVRPTARYLFRGSRTLTSQPDADTDLLVYTYERR